MPRVAFVLLVAGLALLGWEGAAVESHADAFVADGDAAAVAVRKRCRTVRVKLKRHGRIVRRHGKPVVRRVRRCSTVPSPGCRFVKVKQRRNGRVVKRHGKTVYKRIERCPAKARPEPGPGAPAAPAPPAGPAAGAGTQPTPAPQPSPTAEPTPEPPAAEELANRTLALAQHVPGDIDLFTSVIHAGDTSIPSLYPAGSAMAPAEGVAPTEDEVRAQLTAHLNRFFDADADRVADALAVFDDPELAAIAEVPVHRAAIAAMTGTVFEPTIDHLLHGGVWRSVLWGGAPLGVLAAAAPSSGLFVINRRYQFERFEYLIPLMGHESLHDDFGANHNGGSEESILGALTAMTYLQLLSKSPELAYGDTEITRAFNDAALVFINSREVGSPDSEIYAPTGLGVAPGSTADEPDLWTFTNARLPGGIGAGGESAASLPLRTIVRNLLTDETPVPDPLNYTQATAELFENLDDDWLSDVQRAQLSVLLQLVTVEEIAAATDLEPAQIVSTLSLKPYLDAVPG